MKTLLVNHTAVMSGAELALLDLICGAPSDASLLAACPEGPLAEAVSALRIGVTAIRGTDLSFRGHPWYVEAMLAGYREALAGDSARSGIDHATPYHRTSV